MIDWQAIQKKWQARWAQAGRAKATKGKEKFMMVFAYPGVSGYLHVGHMRGFSYTDAICRYQRLKGKEVLFPVGTHASGNQAIAFANKVKKNDEKWISYLKRNGCSDEQLKQLETADGIIDYFNGVYVEEYWKKFGFICDWDRFICTTTPDYEKFIQWQFKKLQQKGLLSQKSYFATFSEVSGPVAVDPSETDLSQGGNAQKNEYTLLKFKLADGRFLVAATLRPETVFGQTNLWVHPTAQHVDVTVGQEVWVMSTQAAFKLSHQMDDVDYDEAKAFAGKQLIGQLALAPGVEKQLPILPAPFCNPDVGSGIVTSVPSHAPFDWIALADLQKDEAACKEYGLDFEMVKSIKPVALIKVTGWGEHPGKEICERDGITSQEQSDQLEVAKKEIYKAEHHTGIMMDIAQEYSGKKVEEAKELVKADLIDQGKAAVMYDLSEEVICRNGGKVFVKRIDDQWFITYSDPELTERSKEHVHMMNIMPQEYKQNMGKILDWFSDRACARLGNWLGSKFPYDNKWTVEPISDSTLYPAYYIVAKFVNNGKITVDELTEEFFDYVYLGKGDFQEKWKAIREEFLYFYPLDVNLGGKEHKTVHFPVYLMNHVAILEEQHWPKGILVNWWVTGKGSKISKSKGGAEPIPDAIEKYGVDAMRLYYAHSGSPHVDIVWDEERVFHYKNALEKIYKAITTLETQEGAKTSLDVWLLSRLQDHIGVCTTAMDNFSMRDLVSCVYFTMYDDFSWYLRRGGKNKEVVQEYVATWRTLMNPVTPHLSEELNDADTLVSLGAWPQVDHGKHVAAVEAGEKLVSSLLTNIREVMKLAKLEKLSEVQLFIAEPWMYELFSALKAQMAITRNVGEVMKAVLAHDSLKTQGKHVTKIVQSCLKDPSKLPYVITSQEQEYNTLLDAMEFLEKEFSCTLKLVKAQESEHPKAKAAWPGRVGIVVA